MAVGIECPVCEAEFFVKKVGENIGIRCPECKRKFRFSENVRIDFSASKSGPRSKPANITATDNRLAAIDPFPSDAAPIANNTAAAAESETAVESTPDSPASKAAIPEVRDRISRKNRRNAILSTAVISISLLAIGILSTLLTLQLTRPAAGKPVAELTIPEDSNAPNSVSALDDRAMIPGVSMIDEGGLPESNDKNETNASESNNLVLVNDEPEEKPAPKRTEDLPERKLEYFSERKLSEVWNSIRPRLLSLEVRTQQGLTPAVGTVIDPRGWALTSHHLAGTSPRVTVTASARDLTDFYQRSDANDSTDDSLLTDDARDVVRSNAKRDITLLTVNDRFVLSLGEITFSRRSNTVAGQFLIQAAPPSPNNPYGVEEIEVLSRQSYDELENDARYLADRLSLNDRTLDWIVTVKKANPAPGTPLLDKHGAISAINVFSTKSYAYFLLTDTVADLVRASGGTQGSKKPIAKSDLLSESHSMLLPSEQMNRHGTACSEFGWIATDRDQFNSLQQFARRFHQVKLFCDKNWDNDSEQKSIAKLRRQMEHFHRSMSQVFNQPLTNYQDSADQMTAIVMKELKRPKLSSNKAYLPFLGSVQSAGIDTPDMDSLFLSVGDQEAIVRVPFGDGGGEMLPGTRWMFLFERDQKLETSRYKSAGRKAFSATHGRLLMAIGPLPK
jgi:hypothetical protein